VTLLLLFSKGAWPGTTPFNRAVGSTFRFIYRAIGQMLRVCSWSRWTIPFAQRVQRSKPAVLYALDAATGKELWSSGATISSFVRGVGPSAGDGQVYVVTYDGTIYAFGIPIEH